MDDLTTYTYGPASKKAPAQLVILLHGLGANGQDLLGLAPLYAQILPDAVFVAPDAPFACDMAPFGYQWFSLQDRDPAIMLKGIQTATPILERYIAAQIAKYNVPASKTALVGFSQGTMMSLYAAPRYPEKLAGVLGYSGALVDATIGGSHKPPVCLIHGDADSVVPAMAWHHARAALQTQGFEVLGHLTPGLMHNIDEEGIHAGAEFLHQILK